MADLSDEFQVKETMVCYRCGGRFWRMEVIGDDLYIICRICQDPNYKVEKRTAVRLDLPIRA